MPRTNAEEVSKIIETDSSDDLAPFIVAATSVVDRIAAHASAPSSTTLEIIERWLAAHYYAVFRQRVSSEKAGPVGENKQHWVGYGFQTTMHGTQALTLDPTGVLSHINAQCKSTLTNTNVRTQRSVMYHLGNT